MDDIQRLAFWRKATMYSDTVAIVLVFIDIYYKNHVLEYETVGMIIFFIAVCIAIISWIMRFKLKKKINSN